MKIFIALLFIISSSLTLASSEIELGQNLQDRRFEVSNTQGEYVEISLSYLGKKLPTVELEGEYAGFECTVVSISRENLAVTPNGKKGDFLVAVEWSPGADASGCVLRITNPHTNQSARISLYMAY